MTRYCCYKREYSQALTSTATIIYDWCRMLKSNENMKGRFSPFKFYSLDLPSQMVVVAQLVRALDCGSRGRGFEPRHPPIFFFLLRISHPFYNDILLTST
jgi:hypothetical protein